MKPKVVRVYLDGNGDLQLDPSALTVSAKAQDYVQWNIDNAKIESATVDSFHTPFAARQRRTDAAILRQGRNGFHPVSGASRDKEGSLQVLRVRLCWLRNSARSRRFKRSGLEHHRIIARSHAVDAYP